MIGRPFAWRVASGTSWHFSWKTRPRFVKKSTLSCVLAISRWRTVSAAKARVGQAMKYVGQQAIQLHGGIGVTNELPAAHYFKRLAMIELTLGDTDHHLARFVAQPGFRQTA